MGGYHKGQYVAATPSKPSRTFDIQIDGTLQTITMSFALFQEIMKVVPDPENIASMLLSDFDLREYIVRRVLTGKKKVKNDEDLFDLWDHDVDDDQMDEMLLWITDHILHFFTDTAARSMALGQRYQAKTMALAQSLPSQTGSPD